ncbi:UNVERIFIED_CONTAM: Transposon Tf2-11 polyprotein [Sesamum calycinum]|uniref:Transposon Tf2-11 polyprotein n=1 Tax=Sesamum calycinum TaxID=2727403 RepID=A0AAW2QZK2_9LAMI
MKDLGAATKILGMEIHRDRGSKKLWLSQRGYFEKVLDRFRMSKAKPVSTLLASYFKLSSEQCPKTDREIENMAHVPYAYAVSCLMYAMVCTRPDLAHAVSQVCKYMSKLGGGPICWKSTVQSIVALPTIEAKHMAVVEVAKEPFWLNGLAKELDVEQGGVQLHFDSQSMAHISEKDARVERQGLIKEIHILNPCAIYCFPTTPCLNLLLLLHIVLLDGHPVAFESRKLKDVERRYLVHEKQLLAVVHCLRLWRHYLLGSPFVVKMDNTAVSHFMTQPKLTSRQACWQELLSKFHFMLEYRAGSSNHVADALSRRADLATLGSIAALSSSAVATSVRDRARELLPGDPAAQSLVHLVKQGKAQEFWLEDGLLMTKGNRLYVPKGGDLRKLLISECHDTLWAGHSREEHTYALVQRAYYWPQMLNDVETYVRTCLICQQDKTDHEKKLGLLQPLPIPKRPWESVSMNYISGLPKVGDLGSIIVVVDLLSKYATFIAAPKHVTVEGTAHLFIKHVVKYWGLPKDIISDRDSHFTGVFWIELFRLLISKLSMSSSYHPQSDGQTERFNSMLKEYLRHFVRGSQKDWGKLLDVAQLCFNAQKSSSTNKSAFEIVTRQQPLLPHTLDSPQAQKRMKKYADNNHRFIEFYDEGPGPKIIKVIKVERSSIDTELQKYSADKEDNARNQPSRYNLN